MKNFQFSIFNFQKNSKFKIQNSKFDEGFTIIETLIALVLLSTALIPALYLSQLSLRASANVRDDMIAAGLAGEGVEIVRGIRDTNWLNSLPFDNGLADGAYRVQWDSTTLLPLSGNQPLKTNNGLYTYTSGTDTVFKRIITISKVNAAELKIISQITWQTQGGNSKTIQAESHIFDWK